MKQETGSSSAESGATRVPARAATKRPSPRDEGVLHAAATKLAPDVAEWLEQEVDDDLINDLAKALGRESDGYRLAKHLEYDWCCSPDAALVEILDSADVYGAQRAAVAAWVAEHGVTLPIPDGTMVRFRFGFDHEVGEITGRDETQATYIVWNERSHSPKQPRCGFLIAAEDCTPLDEAVEPVVEA